MRDHAHTLSDFLVPTLSIECDPCGRRGRYSVAKLMEQHGDAKLPEMRHVLANCPKAKAASVGSKEPHTGEDPRGVRRALHVGEGRADGPSLRLLDRLASRESVRIRTLAIALSGRRYWPIRVLSASAVWARAAESRSTSDSLKTLDQARRAYEPAPRRSRLSTA
jgi:hypothetical protein